MYEIIIVGGGPAGMAASVYAARKRLKTLLISGDIDPRRRPSGPGRA